MHVKEFLRERQHGLGLSWLYFCYDLLVIDRIEDVVVVNRNFMYCDYIVLFVMKKRSCSSQGSEKSQEAVAPRRQKKFITFDYNNNLDCFITSPNQKLAYSHSQTLKSTRLPLKTDRPSAELRSKQDHKTTLSQLRVPRKNIGKTTSNSHQAFNNKLLLLEYQGDDQAKPQTKPQRESPKNQEDDVVVNEIVNSCMRVITEDTEHSSNPISARFTPQCGTPTGSSPMMEGVMMSMMPEEYYYYMMKNPTIRNRRAISNEQSRAYVIDLNRVEIDGRTTIMVRNIPNKYTQDMLLELFQRNHKKKFDFFYLPIDYNNNCNVGYAFLNFIHTKFINDFYIEFHQRKWNKFNSVKVCQVCYARIQGTAQLEHHFEHSNVLQQKDKRFRPLIGMKSLTDNISNLVQKQKQEHSQSDE